MGASRCVAYRPAVLGRAWSCHQGKKRLGAGTREQALGEAKDNRKQARKNGRVLLAAFIVCGPCDPKNGLDTKFLWCLFMIIAVFR